MTEIWSLPQEKYDEKIADLRTKLNNEGYRPLIPVNTVLENCVPVLEIAACMQVDS
jgi:hypothetical protein